MFRKQKRTRCYYLRLRLNIPNPLIRCFSAACAVSSYLGGSCFAVSNRMCEIYVFVLPKVHSVMIVFMVNFLWLAGYLPTIMPEASLFITYPKVKTLSELLTWSHYIELLKNDDPLERSFYEKECEEEHWGVRDALVGVHGNKLQYFSLLVCFILSLMTSTVPRRLPAWVWPQRQHGALRSSCILCLTQSTQNKDT